MKKEISIEKVFSHHPIVYTSNNPNFVKIFAKNDFMFWNEIDKNFLKKFNKKDKINFIKKFSQITVSSICNEYGIDRSNLYRNRTSEKNIDLVFNKIIEKIQELFS